MHLLISCIQSFFHLRNTECPFCTSIMSSLRIQRPNSAWLQKTPGYISRQPEELLRISQGNNKVQLGGILESNRFSFVKIAFSMATNGTILIEVHNSRCISLWEPRDSAGMGRTDFINSTTNVTIRCSTLCKVLKEKIIYVGKTCHKRWTWNLSVCVIHATKRWSSSAGHSVSPSTLCRGREAWGSKQTKQVFMILAFSCALTAPPFPSPLPSHYTRAGTWLPAPEGPQSSKCGPDTFIFYALRLAMALYAILQISRYLKTNIADCQRQTYKGHATKIPGSNTFFDT